MSDTVPGSITDIIPGVVEETDKKARRRGVSLVQTLDRIQKVRAGVNEMSAEKVKEAIPEEFFKALLTSIRIMNEVGLAADGEGRFSLAKYFIDKLGDDRLMKVVLGFSGQQKPEKMKWDIQGGSK